MRNSLSPNSSLRKTITNIVVLTGISGLIVAALMMLLTSSGGGCDSCTLTITGSDSGSYTVSSGDVVCIEAGATFSGSIQRNGNSGNGAVIICNQGTVQNASFSFNKGDNYLENYGTFNPSSLAFNNSTDENEFTNHPGASTNISALNLYTNDTEVKNFGQFQAGTITLSSGAAFENKPDGRVNSGNVELNSNTEAENAGFWEITGNLQINSNGEFDNEDSLLVSGNVEVNSELATEGVMIVDGNFTINGSGEANFENEVSIGGNLTVNKELTQQGTLDIGGNWTTNGSGDVTIEGAVTVAANFTNGGKIYGADVGSGQYGSIVVAGVTTQWGGGKLYDNLDVCDLGSPPNGMDVNWGYKDGTVTHCVNGTISLPVEWLSFEAEPQADGVHLRWATAIEENNDYFTVERSLDASTFEVVTRVEGVGTTSETSYYQAVDPNPAGERIYYRIRQTDFDGGFSFSNLIEVNLTGQPTMGLRLAPNPATDHVTVQLQSEAPGQAQISLMTINGQVLQQTAADLPVGSYQHRFSLGTLSPGTYLVQVRRPGQAPQTERLVKQ